jgi:hypothetical protein
MDLLCLPDDVFRCVFAYLPFQSLQTLVITCKELDRISRTTSNQFWHSLVLAALFDSGLSSDRNLIFLSIVGKCDEGPSRLEIKCVSFHCR